MHRPSFTPTHTRRWDALQRLMCRLLTRLYERAEEHADSIQDSNTLAAVLVQAGAMPPALLAALEAALAAEGLDGQFQVRLELHARTSAQLCRAQKQTAAVMFVAVRVCVCRC